MDKKCHVCSIIPLLKKELKDLIVTESDQTKKYKLLTIFHHLLRLEINKSPTVEVDEDGDETEEEEEEQQEIIKIRDDNKVQQRGELTKRRHMDEKDSSYLKDWMKKHWRNPYPTKDEKTDMMERLGLSYLQLEKRLITFRRKTLKRKPKESPHSYRYEYMDPTR